MGYFCQALQASGNTCSITCPRTAVKVTSQTSLLLRVNEKLKFGTRPLLHAGTHAITVRKGQNDADKIVVGMIFLRGGTRIVWGELPNEAFCYLSSYHRLLRDT